MTGVRADRVRDAEVRDPHGAVGREQDVGWLDVTVNQPRGVRGLQAGRDLRDRIHGRPGAEGTAGQHVRQGRPVDQLHDQVGLPVGGLPVVVDPRDVLVGQGSGVPGQFPKPDEIFELMRFKKPELDAKKRRLDAALTIYDLRDIARRRTPKAAFDYTDGAAESEISLKRARQAFEDVEFHPSILKDVSAVDPSTTVFGGPSALPFGIAPTGFTRLMQTEGEIAGAGAAGAAGIPFSLSTLGTTSIENVKAANPNGRNWFQLYVMRDREVSYDLVRRAAAAGFDTLFFTVDAPVAGARLRDKRNGFSIPPQLTRRHGAQRDPPPLVVVRLPDDAQAGVRLAHLHRRHGGRAARRGDGPHDQLQGPRRHPRAVAGQARRQGRAERAGRQDARTPMTVFYTTEAMSGFVERLMRKGVVNSDRIFVRDSQLFAMNESGEELDLTERVIDEVVRFADCPSQTAILLVKWLLQVASYKPYLFSGFRFERKSNTQHSLVRTSETIENLYQRWSVGDTPARQLAYAE